MLFRSNGDIYSLENIENALTDFIKTTSNGSPTLLAKVSKGTDVDVFFKICEIAHQAGFGNIQLAANTKNTKGSFVH